MLMLEATIGLKPGRNRNRILNPTPPTMSRRVTIHTPRPLPSSNPSALPCPNPTRNPAPLNIRGPGDSALLRSTLRTASPCLSLLRATALSCRPGQRSLPPTSLPDQCVSQNRRAKQQPRGRLSIRLSFRSRVLCIKPVALPQPQRWKSIAGRCERVGSVVSWPCIGIEVRGNMRRYTRGTCLQVALANGSFLPTRPRQAGCAFRRPVPHHRHHTFQLHQLRSPATLRLILHPVQGAQACSPLHSRSAGARWSPTNSASSSKSCRPCSVSPSPGTRALPDAVYQNIATRPAPRNRALSSSFPATTSTR